jgi:hypothetical protein
MTYLQLPVPEFPKGPSQHLRSSNVMDEVSLTLISRLRKNPQFESVHLERRTDHRTAASGNHLPAAYPNLRDGNPIALCIVASVSARKVWR